MALISSQKLLAPPHFLKPPQKDALCFCITKKKAVTAVYSQSLVIKPPSCSFPYVKTLQPTRGKNTSSVLHFVVVYGKQRERTIRSKQLYSIFKSGPISFNSLESVYLYCLCTHNHRLLYITALEILMAASRNTLTFKKQSVMGINKLIQFYGPVVYIAKLSYS